MSILEAVGTYLDANLAAYTLGTNLLLARRLDTPDLMLAVYEHDGGAPDETFGAAATAVDRPTIQVISRAAREDYPTARDAAIQVRSLLGAVSNTTLSGITVLRLRPQGSLMPMGYDEHNRPLVSVNFSAVILP